MGGIVSPPQLSCELNLRMECELQRFGQCLRDSRPLGWVKDFTILYLSKLVDPLMMVLELFLWLIDDFSVFGWIMKIVKTTISLEWILLIIGS